LLQFFVSVHDNWAAPRNRFLQRPTGDQKKSDARFTSLDRHLVAAVEQHQRAVPDFIG
jgi:hypothetical protein